MAPDREQAVTQRPYKLVITIDGWTETGKPDAELANRLASEAASKLAVASGCKVSWTSNLYIQDGGNVGFGVDKP